MSSLIELEEYSVANQIEPSRAWPSMSVNCELWTRVGSRVSSRRVELVELRESLESSCRFVVVSRSRFDERREQSACSKACQSPTNKRRRDMSIGVQSRKLPVAPYSGCTCADSFASTYYVPVPPHTVVIVVISFARFTVQYHRGGDHISFAAVSPQHTVVDCSYFVRTARLLCHCHLTTDFIRLTTALLIVPLLIYFVRSLPPQPHCLIVVISFVLRVLCPYMYALYHY